MGKQVKHTCYITYIYIYIYVIICVYTQYFGFRQGLELVQGDALVDNSGLTLWFVADMSNLLIGGIKATSVYKGKKIMFLCTGKCSPT